MKYLSIFLLATFALAGDAPISTDSKGSPSLIAKFEKTSKSNIEGTIKFTPANNGTVSVSVDLKGLPSDIGPFPYHVHENQCQHLRIVLLPKTISILTMELLELQLLLLMKLVIWLENMEILWASPTKLNMTTPTFH